MEPRGVVFMRTIIVLLCVASAVPASAQQALTPPAVGQPADFSGVVGMFRMEAKAAPTSAAVEEPIELTVEITGQAVGAYAPKQARLKLFPADIDKTFFIEPVSEHAGAGSWRFVYRLRPKSTGVTHIPGLKLTYYAPRQKRYQAAYADAIPINVRPRTEPKVEVQGLKIVAAPPSFFEWAEMPDQAAGTSQFELSWLVIVLIVLTPPLLAAIGLHLWRRTHPSSALAQARRKHRAATVAVGALTANHRPAPEVVAVVTEYFRRRLDFPAAEPTPAEVERWLKRRGVRPELRRRWRRFFQECDELRYRPAGLADGWLPATEAAVLIQELEADPCVAGRH
jgi:hypothetical protein